MGGSEVFAEAGIEVNMVDRTMVVSITVGNQELVFLNNYQIVVDCRAKAIVVE